ncbi:acyltransferase family protein [Rhodopila sp.]|uniref:acyltransferase family protein n=1 Tax=Rhodopila sp. TaxID=2480087 RepID=UPI003D0F18AE
MKRLECLDGLRGALAVYVLFGHMAPFATLPAWLQDGVSHGEAAVDMFFILSGLVITQSLDRAGGRAVPFLMARAARIFPVFVPVFVVAVLIQPGSCGFDRMPWIGPDNAARTICVTDWPHAWPAAIAAHLTMTHGLLPNGVLPHVWVSFLGAAWSLSTEWQFYLLALLASRGGASRLTGGLMLLAIVGVAWQQATPESWQFSRAFLANKAHFFALGVASLAVVRQRRGALVIYGVTLAASLAVCASYAMFGKMLPPLVWTLCLTVQMRQATPGLRWFAGLLRCQAAQYLGAISYCIYLVNEPIHKVLAATLSRLADGDPVVFTALWLPSAIVLPILLSAWLHTHVEMPALRWGRGAAGAALRARLPVGARIPAAPATARSTRSS